MSKAEEIRYADYRGLYRRTEAEIERANAETIPRVRAHGAMMRGGLAAVGRLFGIASDSAAAGGTQAYAAINNLAVSALYDIRGQAIPHEYDTVALARERGYLTRGAAGRLLRDGVNYLAETYNPEIAAEFLRQPMMTAHLSGISASTPTPQDRMRDLELARTYELEATGSGGRAPSLGGVRPQYPRSFGYGGEAMADQAVTFQTGADTFFSAARRARIAEIENPSGPEARAAAAAHRSRWGGAVVDATLGARRGFRSLALALGARDGDELDFDMPPAYAAYLRMEQIQDERSQQYAEITGSVADRIEMMIGPQGPSNFTVDPTRPDDSNSSEAVALARGIRSNQRRAAALSAVSAVRAGGVNEGVATSTTGRRVSNNDVVTAIARRYAGPVDFDELSSEQILELASSAAEDASEMQARLRRIVSADELNAAQLAILEAREMGDERTHDSYTMNPRGNYGDERGEEGSDWHAQGFPNWDNLSEDERKSIRTGEFQPDPLGPSS